MKNTDTKIGVAAGLTIGGVVTGVMVGGLVPAILLGSGLLVSTSEIMNIIRKSNR